MSSDLDIAIAKWSPAQQSALRDLRTLIHQIANGLEGAPAVAETLKWGQPSFSVKTGSPVRIDGLKGTETGYAVYFICTTGLVGTFRELYPQTFRFEGNRAILLDTEQPFDRAALGHCLALALTYRIRRKS